MNRDELIDAAMELAEQYARKFFRGSDRDENVNDAKSMAWQIARNASERATPATVAFRAVLRVKVSGQFRWSIRTVDHPHATRRHHRVTLGFDDLMWDADPAEIAQIRIDMDEWLWNELSALKRKVAFMLMAGCGVSEIARVLKKTPGRISQIRQELRDSWLEFTGEG